MKRIIQVLLMICIPFTGCNTTNEKMIQEIAKLETEPNAVKKLVDENTYIDFDYQDLVIQMTSDKRASVDKGLLAKSKVALYRFYSHVQLVDDQYVCSLKDGSEINVSERVFVAMSDDLDQMNTSIRENKEKGANLVIFKPDAKYLNSLLDLKIYSNSDSQKTDIEFVKAKAQMVDKQIAKKFDELFESWKTNWKTNPKTQMSSNTNDAKKLDEYPELLSMGKEIIPLLMEKMVSSEDNFFALNLYDALQDHEDLKIIYKENDPNIYEGEQARVIRTVKLWVQSNK